MVVEFHPGALEDVLEAATEYESQREGLGEHFVAAVAGWLEKLEDHPRRGVLLTGATAPRAFRSLRLSRFPYKIVYLASPERIDVIAVGHHRRRANFWSSRVAGR